MSGRAARVAAAARGCVGARFRPQGRDPATGLDCVGLVGWALRAGGWRGALPGGYALRGGDARTVAARIAAAGLAATGDYAEGAVVLVLAGPHQFHLLIRTGAGHVHADAGLRRVVEEPGPPRWPAIGRWRLRDTGEGD